MRPGRAAEAIQSLLFEQPGRLEPFRAAISSLTSDPHPAVRVAAMGVAIPLLNIDRDAAVATFLAACSHEDDRVLLSRHIPHFFRYTILDYAGQIRPLVERMIKSPLAEVAKAGAFWVGAAWGHRGVWTDLLEACLAGESTLREGTAKVLAQCVASGRSRDDAAARLAHLFNDPEKAVRDEAASVFRLDGMLGRPGAPSLVGAFVESAALEDNADDLLWGLEQHAGRLKPFAPALSAVVDRFAGPLAAERATTEHGGRSMRARSPRCSCGSTSSPSRTVRYAAGAWTPGTACSPSGSDSMS